MNLRALLLLVTAPAVLAQSDDVPPADPVFDCGCFPSYVVAVSDGWTAEENIIGTSAYCSTYSATPGNSGGCEDLANECEFDVELEARSPRYMWTIEEPLIDDFARIETKGAAFCSEADFVDLVNNPPAWFNSPYAGDVAASAYLFCSGCTIIFGT
ncbi:MAG: hypothetical protein AAF726_25450 [Planctomycetota bacterium]